MALYEEPDVLVKVIRDLFNEDFTGLIVSGDDAWNTINDYVTSVAPELLPRMTKYEPAASGGPDVFAVHRIDEQLTKAMDRKVWLPSGGTLVIDRTEAMTVVDVNTGKFTGSGGNLEQTVTRNNLEAAEETVRQLRLRDIGGIIVIDFIDMVLESNRDLVLRRLTEALARDRTRHQVSEVTSLGLVQLTRKKLGTGLIEAFSTTCSHCAGRGIMLHGDPVDSGVDAPAARASRAPAAAASAARRVAGPRKRSRSPRCPCTPPVSIRCSGPWPRPPVARTATRRTATSPRTPRTTVVEGSEDVAATEPVEEVAGRRVDDDDDDDSDDEDSDDDLEDDDDDDEDDDDIEVIDDDDSMTTTIG